MNLPDRCRPFWDAFARTCAVDPTPRFLEAFHFDDNPADADALAALVLAGRKRATAALHWTHEATSRPLPKPGDLSIVTSFAGEPVCVIETRQVDVVPFDEVTEAFAAAEGEGDGSLALWRRVHDAYFRRECARIGRTPDPRMPVVCERFEVVHRATPAGDTAEPRGDAVRRIRFSIDIAASPARVFRLMLDPDGYRDWTAPFAQGSYYEGTWRRGERIRFMSPSGDGMVSEIAEHRPDAFTSIRHLGVVRGGVEDTDSEAVRAWAPACENYTFTPTAEGTRVTVDQDVTAEFEADLARTWPKALERLKALCESATRG